MKRFFLTAVAAAFALASAMVASAQSSNNDAANKELNSAAQIIQEMTGPNSTAGVPHQVLEDAKCIAVIPNLIQGGFIVGARHGDGVATCRLAPGRWSPPAPFSLTGGSFGAQIGGQDISLIMMIMNSQGMEALMSGHFKVGGELSGAAGPVGRQAAASAGWKAAILTYSRTKGLYAGATIKGAELNQNKKVTDELYGRDVSFDSILKGQVNTPNNAAVHDFLRTIHSAEVNARAQ
jgi:SH3 domain-containing YSC84-like protein 1